MRYFGGKTRICKDIASLLGSVRKPGQSFLSPFVGGGWVECLVPDSKQCSDRHPYLIAMYQELQRGWKPPRELTVEEYRYIKDHKDEKPYLTGFVGFGCSFAGKWFGGYAKEKAKRNFCLNAYNSILNKMKGFSRTQFQCIDYKELKPDGMLIYCDPPYYGTTQYARLVVGDFNSDEFWEVMRLWGKNNTVMISEYTAPDDFKCIWSKKTKIDMKDKNNCNAIRVEKIYTPNQDVIAGNSPSLFE